MTTTTEAPATIEQLVDPWARLRAPFRPEEIEKLPKPFSANADKGKCDERHKDRNGVWCDGYHGLPAIHLSYVGHAGVTMRLNEVCGPDGWSWRPAHTRVDPHLMQTALATGNPEIVRMLLESSPPMQSDQGLWIYLTVMGQTKMGFGDAQGKSGANATKELIGDAIRNAAMRFGIGTYLWSKSEAAAAMTAREDGVDIDAVGDYAPAVGRGNGPDPEQRQRARSDNRKLARPTQELTERQRAQQREQDDNAARADLPSKPAERVSAADKPAETDPWAVPDPAVTPPAAQLAGSAARTSSVQFLGGLLKDARAKGLERENVADHIDPMWAVVLDVDTSAEVTLGQWMFDVKAHLDKTQTSVADTARRAEK